MLQMAECKYIIKQYPASTSTVNWNEVLHKQGSPVAENSYDWES